VSEIQTTVNYRDLVRGVLDRCEGRSLIVPLSGDETARQVEVSQRKMRDLDKQLRSLFEALAADWKPADKDREAAWEIHVELRTRISTQRLHYLDGDEGAALDSLVKLFPIVRDVCRKHGSAAVVTLAVADLMLNHSLRELTASWHDAPESLWLQAGKSCRRSTAAAPAPDCTSSPPRTLAVLAAPASAVFLPARSPECAALQK